MYFFSQSTGRISQGISNTMTVLGFGYAGGNCGKNPEGVNNPEMEGVRCVGPLPRGVYAIGRPQDPPTHLGPCAMPLTPNNPAVMLGRSAFFLHPDNVHRNHSASEGCPVQDESVLHYIAEHLAEDDQLTVTA